MTDKEVGELWAIYKTMEHDPVHRLIRKLVEERVGWGESQDDVLADFGIDPKEFKP
jgi:hypothetical protein